MTVSKLKHLNTSKLKVHPNNPRFIKDAEFKALIKSIQEDSEYFEARPIICSDRTGELVILGGNQRFRAACELKLKTVPVIVFSDLTEADEVRLMLKDNANNFGQFDWDIMATQDWDELIKENEDWGVLLPVDDFNEFIRPDNFKGEKSRESSFLVEFLKLKSQIIDAFIKNGGDEINSLNEAEILIIKKVKELL